VERSGDRRLGSRSQVEARGAITGVEERSQVPDPPSDAGHGARETEERRSPRQAGWRGAIAGEQLQVERNDRRWS
jgi:hypothetical protein